MSASLVLTDSMMPKKGKKKRKQQQITQQTPWRNLVQGCSRHCFRTLLWSLLSSFPRWFALQGQLHIDEENLVSRSKHKVVAESIVCIFTNHHWYFPVFWLIDRFLYSDSLCSRALTALMAHVFLNEWLAFIYSGLFYFFNLINMHLRGVLAKRY